MTDLEKLASKFITLYEDIFTDTGNKRKHHQISDYNMDSTFFNRIIYRGWVRDIVLIIYQLIIDNFIFLRSEFEGYKKEKDKVTMEDIKKILKLKNWCKWNDDSITGNTSKLSICEILYQNLELYSSVLKFDNENKYLKVFITESYRRSRLCPFCYNKTKFSGKCTNNHGIHILDNQLYLDEAIFFSDEKISFDPKIAKKNCNISLSDDFSENKDRYTVFKGFIPVVCLLNEKTVEIKQEYLKSPIPISPKTIKIRCLSPPAKRMVSLILEIGESEIRESDEEDYTTRFKILKNGLNNIEVLKESLTSSLSDWDDIPKLCETPNSFSNTLANRVSSF